MLAHDVECVLKEVGARRETSYFYGFLILERKRFPNFNSHDYRRFSVNEDILPLGWVSNFQT